MSATSAVEILRQIGVDGICAKTHISRSNVEALLREEFENFSSVQFSGFVTILEREYDLDLSEWRQRFSQTAPDKSPLSEHENDPFANVTRSKKRQQRTMVGLVVLLIVLVTVTVVVLNRGEDEKKFELNNTAIEKARDNLASMSAASESNGTIAAAEAIQETHQSEAVEAEVTQETVVYEDVIIRPRTNVWIGVIDARENKRFARTTEEPWRLDGSKEWLIVTGHGLLSLECGGVNASFAQRDRLLFLYEDGKCRQIDTTEFKARNGGKVW